MIKHFTTGIAMFAKKIMLGIAVLLLLAGGFYVLNLSEVSAIKKEKGPNPDRPDLAILQDIERTKDLALGYVPRERLMNVISAINQQKKSKTFTPMVGDWNERGPSNIGGRTRALMFDPNDSGNGYKKVWAGGVGGGLWYTNDITVASPTWVAVNDFWANIAVSCIAYDPSNTQVFYVGTGEGWFNVDAIQGAGIWKTTDGGATWAQLSSTNNSTFYHVQKIVVENDGDVYAATRAGGIMRSTNGGASWTQVLAGRAADLEISADGTLFGTIGIFTTGGIYKSTDGTTWNASYTSAAGEARIEIACAPSDANTLYAMVHQTSNNGLKKIMKSTNAGGSWSTVTQPTWCDQGTTSNDMTRGQAWYDMILTVDPNSPSTVYAGGVDIMKSTNSGSTWSQITRWSGFGGCSGVTIHADQHAMAFRPGSSTVAVVGNDGGVYYTSNGGTSFSNKNTGYNVTQFYSCAIHPTSGQNYFLAGAQDNGTQKFDAAGIDATVDMIGGDGAFCFIDQDNPTYQIGSYVYNNYYRSTNGGTSFASMTSDNNGDFINPADYDDVNNILYSGYNTANLFRVTNVTGTPSSGTIAISGMSANATHIRVSPNTPTTIFVGSGGDVFKVENANTTASPVTNISTGLPAGSISCIEVGATDNDLIVTYSNYGMTSVWRSTNGGTSWSSREGNLPDMPVRWALINPNNSSEVILATEVGVWKTSDITVASPTWTAYTDFPNVRVDMLQTRGADDEVIAATHGRGLFSSSTVFAAGGGNPPVANFTASATTVCVGSAINFTDQSTNTPTSWSWTFQGGTPPTSTSQNPSVTYTVAGTYSVSLTATNGDGSDTENKTGYITVNAKPTVTIAANPSATICSGSSVTLTASGASTYAWSGGETTASIIKNPISLTGYSVMGTDNNGCTNSASQVITTKSLPNPSIVANPATICSGSSATLTASGGNSFVWSGSGETTASVVKSPTINTTYTVTSTAANGCTKAVSKALVVKAPSLSMSKTDASCSQNNGSATATPSGGRTPYTYSWLPGGETTQSIAGLAAGTYTCSVLDADACSMGSGTVTINAVGCGSTNLQPAYCGITVTYLDQKVYCVAVSGATNYQYSVTHPASGYSGTYTRNANATDFSLHRLSGIKYGTTYEVRVRAYVNGSWGSYGTVCMLSSPAIIPTTKIRAADCGATLAAVSTRIYCDAVSGTTGYRYRVQNTSLGFDQYYTRIPNVTDFRLSYVGAAINTTYSVSVAAIVGNDVGPFGVVCQVTTGPVLRLAGDFDEENTMTVFPNPITGSEVSIMIEGMILGEEVQVEVYDMMGSKVFSGNLVYENDEGITLPLDGSFHKGVYFVNAMVANRKFCQKFVITN